jgi:hypothetical protein
MTIKNFSARRLVSLLSASALLATMVAGTLPGVALATAPPGPYFNGFENTADVGTTDQAMFNVSQVTTGPGSTTSATGTFHALADAASGAFTRYGGYSAVFPTGGYTTSVDIFLDMTVATGANDLRFDWSSAISNTSTVSGAEHFRRDFIFNVGTDPTTAGQFKVSASNNAPGWPSDPGRNPIAISTTGWYTFQHHFYDAGSGMLAVDLTVRALGSTTALGAWTLSDPTDIIGTTVGGNRYGWLVTNDLPLALDNITRSGTTLGACAVAISGSSPTTYTLLADCVTDQTIFVPQNGGGSVFDGSGHSITGIDPTAGHFLGAVVQAQSGTSNVTVKNLTVTVAGLADICDLASNRLSGIRFDNVGGLITNNHVVDIEQGANGQSGCQEGNAIDVRNAPFDRTGTDKKVTVSNNVVTDYQKTGILANGSVAAIITGNTITGDGPIGYIAQNGIQVGFGATATVKNNSSTANWYSPSTDIACGFLIYQADGVNASSNNFFNNERNQCNFGKGGGTSKPSNP